jgi:very-short-patch-repair endonuclease
MQKLFNLSEHAHRRRELRQQKIACERILWGKLRNRQLGGLKFKRQFSIDKYVADFYCANYKLIIEIDGATHSTDQEVQYDNVRQRYLESFGIIVKRFTNTEVKENLNLVLEDILGACKTPSPQPSPGRERESEKF